MTTKELKCCSTGKIIKPGDRIRRFYPGTKIECVSLVPDNDACIQADTPESVRHLVPPIEIYNQIRCRRPNPICEFGQIASPQSVHQVDCASEATYEAVDVLAPALERVQKPVCTGHARFLHGQGFWIFPQGDDEAQSLGLSDIK